MFDKLINFIKGSIISTYFSKIGLFIKNIFTKLIGKERVDNWTNKYVNYKNNLKNIFKSRFDTEGSYSSLIFKIYKFTLKSIIGVFIYLFLLKTNFLWLTGGMPSIEQLQNPKISTSSIIYSADGVEIGKFFTENRTPVDSNLISPWVFKSLIATEDKRFFEHSGIDLQRMASVALGIFSGGNRGGGSTISQQLAKNLYNTRKKDMRGLLYYIPVVKTLIYKTKEWLTAIDLEERFTKGEIATMYLNTVDYGNNAYGIKTASKTYFNKTPLQLSISEAAVLVGLQKATTYYNPIKNPKNAKKRRNTVIQRLVQNGDLSKEEGDKIINSEIVTNVNIENPYDGQGNYFKVALAKQIEKWSDENEIEIDLYTDGLKIYTTIDSRMQTHAEDAVETQMRSLQKEFENQWQDKNPWTYENGEEIPDFIENVAKRTNMYKILENKYNGNLDSVNFHMNKKVKMKVFTWDGDRSIEKEMSQMDSIRYYKRFLQCGMMSFDPFSGFIKSWVGGIDFNYFKYDHVKQGKRQPGSTFKPIVYASAIDGPLNLGPCDTRKDQPVKLEVIQDGEKKFWEPKNANGGFTYSNLSLRKALARSVNSVAVQLTLDVTPKIVIEYAKKFGIISKLQEVPSIGLGTSDISLFEMVGAYGVFANEGNYTKPIFMFKIEDSSGKVLWEFESETKQVIRQESAYLMQYLLRGNIEEAGGTGRRMFNYNTLFQNGGQVAGKTGTTSNNSDSWYIGFTKDLVCGVWVGGDDRSIHFRSSMGEGSRSALPIFGAYMEKVYQDKNLGYKAGPFPKPSIKIEKDYLSCFVPETVKDVYVNDSLLNVMLSDSIGKINDGNPIDTANLKAKIKKILQRKKPADSTNSIRKNVTVSADLE